MRTLRKICAALCFFAAMALVNAAAAQEVPTRKTMSVTVPSEPGGSASGLPSVLEIPINKAHVIHLPAAVSNIVIGNETVADIHLEPSNPSQVFVVSKEIGSTNVFFMGTNGAIVHQVEIRVTIDDEGLKAALAKLMPDENIGVSVYGDSVFLGGSVHSASAAANAVNISQRFVSEAVNVINMLTVTGSQQVILQVRVAEISRSVRKNLSASTSLNLSLPAEADIGITTTGTTPTLTSFGTGTLITDLSGFGPVSFEALERQSLAKTLAEPVLTAISGQTASFLSGGETPVPAGVDENGNAVIEFRDFGINLEFTPVVHDKGRISLQIAAEISAIDATNSVTVVGSVVSGFTTKRTETTVDLPSGGTLMLSGLLEDNISDTINGFPYLKDIPILGSLFRSTEFQLDETELIITITAYLANPTGNNAGLTLPTDGFEPASDIDIYLLGRLHRTYGEGENQFWQDPIMGPFGYIMK